MPQTNNIASGRVPAAKRHKFVLFNRAWTIVLLAVLAWVVVLGLLKLIGLF